MHVDLERGLLDYPRHKTGNERHGYLWKRTRDAIDALLHPKHGHPLKHAKLAFDKDGKDALVFVTRAGRPYYWEEVKKDDGKIVVVQVHNALSITFSRLAKACGLEGVTFYRLRHTFKTLGKRAKDRDALNLCMGHKTNSVEEGYDHEADSLRAGEACGDEGQAPAVAAA
jgi:integrase